jgi:hypothetical protein
VPRTAASCRLCCKSLFAPLIANFSSCRRGFRVNMPGKRACHHSYQRSWLVSTSGGKFVTRRFQTFATQSPVERTPAASRQPLGCRLSHNDGIKGARGWRHAASKIVGCNQSIGIEESDFAHSKRVRRVHVSGILSALFSALLPFALFASEAASAQEVKQIMFLPGAA